jgi:hypothetical protein
MGQEMAGVREVYDGAMRPDVEVKTFAHSDQLFPMRVVDRGSAARALPKAKTPLNNVFFEAGGKRYDLFDYLALNRVVGLLIVKNGEVVLEDYELGTGPGTCWPSYSIAKSVTSTLIGAALQDGSVGSLDDPVTKYVPMLKGGAYEGVSVRNVIQMASGVRWNETVYGSDVRSQETLGNSASAEAGDDSALYDGAVTGWGARDDLELQHGRNVCCGSGVGRCNAQTPGGVFVRKDLEAVGNGVPSAMATGIAAGDGMGRRRAFSDAAGFWTDRIASASRWDN